MFEIIKNSLNSFKHGVKKHFFKKLTKNKIFLLIKKMCHINIYFKLLFDSGL